MSTLTFLVEVHTERQSGMHASLSDQEDHLSEAISDALGSEVIDSIGPNANSSYSIDSVYVEALTKHTAKETRATYEQSVAAEAPNDAELRKQIRELRAKLSSAESTIERLEQEKTRASEEISKSRISQRDRGSKDAVPTYLRDGKYDFVTFQYGERWDERLDVGFSMDETGIEVRNVAGKLSIESSASNVFTIHPVKH